MRLQDELGLRRGFEDEAHETILGLYFAAALLRKRADVFFRAHGLTDAQFNALMALHYQAEESTGLTQVELGRMLLVNRANITALVDRMEKAGLVERVADPEDRRCNRVRMTARGKGLFLRVEPDYLALIHGLTQPLHAGQLQTLRRALEKIRDQLRTQLPEEEPDSSLPPPLPHAKRSRD